MSVARGKILKFNKRRAFNKDIGSGKLINVGPSFIPDNRVVLMGLIWQI